MPRVPERLTYPLLILTSGGVYVRTRALDWDTTSMPLRRCIHNYTRLR